MSTINVAVVDDHELFREGVISMLSREASIRIVGEGDTAAAAECLAAQKCPDVMLLDVTMPGGGLAAARSIAKSYPGIKILMLTASDAALDVVEAFDSGVVGYVLKGMRKSELIEAVQTAFRGDTVLAPSLAGRILKKMRANAEANIDDGLGLLTAREAEVLSLVAQGLSNKEVARKLDLTERTIKNNMTSIMQKLQVSNRVEATLRLRPHRG